MNMAAKIANTLSEMLSNVFPISNVFSKIGPENSDETTLEYIFNKFK